MKQQSFEQKYQSLWDDFERQLDALEKRGRPQASVLQGFATHYRHVCTSLALAQERQYSPYLIDRLNGLALRGHQHFYRRPGHGWHQVVQFILWGFPAAVRREAIFVWLGVLLFFGPLLVMGVLTWANPDLVYGIYQPESVKSFVAMYDPASKENLAQTRGSAENLQMFGFYVRNNIGIGFQTFASGFLLGIGALFNLVYNGLAIGAVAGYLTEAGYTQTFWPFVIGHGAFELTAIAIAGGAGLKLGYGLLAPGRLSRKQSLIRAAREAMPLVYGMFFYLLIAAFLEAFWSSSAALPNATKFWAGGCFWLLSISYLCLGVRFGSR